MHTQFIFIGIVLLLASELFSTSQRASLYALLECDRNASYHQIRCAYRRLAKIYHPDRLHAELDMKIRESMLRKYNEIQKAYATLKHVDTRRMYDLMASDEGSDEDFFGFSRHIGVSGIGVWFDIPGIVSGIITISILFLAKSMLVKGVQWLHVL